ncbi:MAG: twin-arginine translocation signal domain-containing protein, partial [Synergistaceae bacterium]|nr:twin-arginine translocation signal domain-containing protein [Synergistaceae bacterium]
MGLIDTISKFKLGRRAFLKWSAAVSALTALTGYENELKKITPAEAQEISQEKGE